MDKKGFTVFELVTVIAIIGIMLSIALPSYSSWLPRYRLKTSVRHIYDDMNLAKIQAVKSGTVAVVIFHPASNSYDIFLDTSDPLNYALDGGETIIRQNASLEDGVNIYETTLASNTCGFNNRGMPTGQGQVHLTSSSGLFMGVQVNTPGYISIIESSDGGGTWG